MAAARLLNVIASKTIVDSKSREKKVLWTKLAFKQSKWHKILRNDSIEHTLLVNFYTYFVWIHLAVRRLVGVCRVVSWRKQDKRKYKKRKNSNQSKNQFHLIWNWRSEWNPFDASQIEFVNNSWRKMPCEACNIQFTVFKRKKPCTECRWVRWRMEMHSKGIRLTHSFRLQATLLQQLSDQKQRTRSLQTLYRIHHTATVENRIAEVEGKRFDILFAVEAHFDDWMCG